MEATPKGDHMRVTIKQRPYGAWSSAEERAAWFARITDTYCAECGRSLSSRELQAKARVCTKCEGQS
jgi:hypothetical protein